MQQFDLILYEQYLPERLLFVVMKPDKLHIHTANFGSVNPTQCIALALYSADDAFELVT
jgi:hypothetical protein